MSASVCVVSRIPATPISFLYSRWSEICGVSQLSAVITGNQTVKTNQTLQTVQTQQTVRAGQTVFAIIAECHLTARLNCQASALRPRYVRESARVNGSHRSDCPRWRVWPVNTVSHAVRSLPRSGASRLMG